MRIITLFLLLGLALNSFGRGGDRALKNHSVFFLQPELLFGKILPGNSNFPETSLNTVYSLSFGRYVCDPNKAWSSFYNYPQIGLTVSKSSFGHDQIYGVAYTAMPFISFNTSKKLRNSFNIKAGLGASYFTKTFDKEENPDNLAIGSTITWTFQTSFNYTLILTRHFTINLGAGYIHHSNGHTQLPNLGLNSFLASISSTVYLSPLTDYHMKNYDKPKPPKTRQYFIEFRSGLGMHEMGGPNSVVEKIKKGVFSITAGGGIIFKRMIKVKAGIMYRYYHHYYNYITQIDAGDYGGAPVLNSSSLTIYVGSEFLLGHVGMDVEIGVNIYKPFYKEHSQMFEDDNSFSYTLKRIFTSRLGLKLYALSTSKNPRNNVFLGVHINANMGQADFSELSFGFVHRFKNIRTKK